MLELGRGPFEVEVQADAAMYTRDGKRLLTDIYRPKGSTGKLPTLVRRTPYGKRLNDLAEPFNEAHYFASHGYLVVVQNTRGRFGSEGTWYPFVYEGRDGYDTIEWAAALPESNGRVGTFGQSYGAISQYLAAAQRPPHLVTAIPVSAYLLAFENYWYNRGALELSWTLSYFANMAVDVLTDIGDDDRLAALEKMKSDPTVRFAPLTDEALRHLPLTDWIDRFGAGAPFLVDILRHSKDGPYWWGLDLRRQVHNIDVPMLHVGSWYDIANWDTPQYFTLLKDQATSTRGKAQALFMGPWAHLLPYSQPTSRGTGDIDFGPEAAHPMLEVQRSWFDHFVRAGREGLPRPAVTIFVMGENKWRSENEWPLARTTWSHFYLGSGGNANTASGDGVLRTDPPTTPEPPDIFVYDPDNPVPTMGGRYVGGGVRDQVHTQARADVLVYDAEVFREPVEVTGPLELVLFASTSAKDTDFVGVLSDVHPDGFVQNLAEGLVRTRYRNAYDEPELLEPDRAYEFRIHLGNLSHLFKPGHRLRLHVTSSDFPRWDRNTNTGEDVRAAVETLIATQRILHDPAHPSRLVVPIVGTASHSAPSPDSSTVDPETAGRGSASEPTGSS